MVLQLQQHTFYLNRPKSCSNTLRSNLPVHVLEHSTIYVADLQYLGSATVVDTQIKSIKALTSKGL